MVPTRSKSAPPGTYRQDVIETHNALLRRVPGSVRRHAS